VCVYQSVSVCVVAFRNQVPTFAAIDVLNRNVEFWGPGLGKSFQTIIPDREEKEQHYRILTFVREAAPGATERADAPGEAKKIGRERLFLVYVQRGEEKQKVVARGECKKEFGPWGRKNPQRFPQRKGCFRTLVMGPAVPEKEPRWPEPPWLDTAVVLGLGLDLKAVMLWETPSAKMNCSRSSMLVRPLAGWFK
jgi:hypothetical protein